MSYLRFQHVFGGLMALSAASAFLVPAKYSNRAYPGLQAMFAPVSRPAGAIARSIHDRMHPAVSTDRRDVGEVKAENDALRVELAAITRQYQDLQQRNNERSRIGIRNLCTPFAVIGTDPGPHESLLIQGSLLDGLRDGAQAVCPGGIVGRVQRAGAGAQVRLITDYGFRVRAGFTRYVMDSQGQPRPQHIKAPEALVEGIGRGQMIIRMLTWDDVSKTARLTEGDWVVLSDPDWPAYLQDYRLGRITRIQPRRGAPGFAEILVEPPESLLRLREVMVVTKDKS